MALLQLLVQVGQVSQRVLHKHEKEAREAGKASFFLAWVSGAARSLDPTRSASRGDALLATALV